MKILFILNDYYPMKNSSGVCTDSLVQILKQRKDEVHIICYMDQYTDLKIDGVYIHGIKADDYEARCNFPAIPKSRIKKITELVDAVIYYPVPYMGLAKRLTEATERVAREYQIEMAVSVVHPVESMVAVYELKKKHPEIKTVIYELDAVSDLNVGKKGIRKLLYDKRLRFEEKIYDSADRIIHMRCHEKHFEQERYRKYDSKRVLSDFPLFQPELCREESQIILHKCLKFVYSGALMKGIRSPEYVVEFLKKFSEEHEMEADFYSRGDYETFLEDVGKECKNIYRKGWVATEEVHLAMEQADCLISIGNEIRNMVPSKSYAYISHGKPVIHFANIEDDPCIDIFGKYELALILDSRDSVDENIKKLNAFLQKINGKSFSVASVECFKENTPAYTIQCMVDHWKVFGQTP